MRNSSGKNLIAGVLLALVVGFGALFVFQSAWLKVIQVMLRSSQASGLPTSPTLVIGVSLPTASAPVPAGVESRSGNVAITVTRVVRPASYIVGMENYSVLEQDEEYLLVDIAVRCLSTAGPCRLTEFDFGVKSSSGRDAPAELSGGFSGVQGLFEGGEVEPGESLSGSLIFVVKEEDLGLVMYYPRMFGFGGEAKFILE